MGKRRYLLRVFANCVKTLQRMWPQRAVFIVCYTVRMFIHRIFVMSCSDRGAWPWRTLPSVTKHA
jgi:hypothetical protein